MRQSFGVLPLRWGIAQDRAKKRDRVKGRALLKGLIQVKDLSSFLQLKCHAWIFRSMPLFMGRAYLGFLGWLYFLVRSKERSNIKKALEHAFPHKAERPTWRSVRKGIFDHYHEKIFLGFKPFSHIKRCCLEDVTIENQEILDQALSKNKGVILVTGHIGAVEFLPPSLAFRGYRATAMVHCKSKGLLDTITAHATRCGLDLLDPKSGTVFFSALKELKEKRILITQCDEIDMWRPHRNRYIRFLGFHVGLDRSMDILAGKSKAPLVLGVMHRLPGRKYRLVLQDPAKHPLAQGLPLTSAKCLAVLNSIISAEPNAWYEWKKLARFFDQTKAREDEIKASISIPDQMAVPDAGGA